MKLRCFVCSSGHVWSICVDGSTNYPAEIRIEGVKVQILGAKDDLGPGRAIEAEYDLWDSLTELALRIEHSPTPSTDGSVSLEQAVADELHNVIKFEKFWISNNAKNPDHYPMTFPVDNAGIWAEQIRECNPE